MGFVGDAGRTAGLQAVHGHHLEPAVGEELAHFLVADGVLLSHRRTRAGDASEAGTRPTTAGVTLGMPRIGVPDPLPAVTSC